MSVLDQILPILFLILAGMSLRLFNVLSPQIMEGLTKLVVNLVLPSVLFTIFLDMAMKASYLGVFVVTAAICGGLYALGAARRAETGTKSSLFSVPDDRL